MFLNPTYFTFIKDSSEMKKKKSIPVLPPSRCPTFIGQSCITNYTNIALKESNKHDTWSTSENQTTQKQNTGISLLFLYISVSDIALIQVKHARLINVSHLFFILSFYQIPFHIWSIFDPNSFMIFKVEWSKIAIPTNFS